MHDAVSIEHRIGDVIGANGRGHVGDADRVRRGKPEYLAGALDKAAAALRKRIEKLPDSDRMKFCLENSMEAVDDVRSRAVSTKDKEFPTLLLWETCAALLHMDHMYLETKNL